MLRPLPRAVFLDVGFTLTSYDGERLATWLAESGAELDPAAVLASERRVRAEAATSTFQFRPDETSALSSGARFFRRILELSSAVPPPGKSLDDLAVDVWQRHLARNVFRRVLPGVREALARLTAAGMELVVVSNSEGTVEAMLEEVGLRAFMRAVLDSWTVGTSKPDARIFEMAIERAGLASPGEGIMVGDSPVADVAGATSVGLRAALIDPFDLHPAVAVPRFPGLAAFTDALLGGAG